MIKKLKLIVLAVLFTMTNMMAQSSYYYYPKSKADCTKRGMKPMKAANGSLICRGDDISKVVKKTKPVKAKPVKVQRTKSKKSGKSVNKKKIKTYTKFEKSFVNHIAYNHYEKAVKLMFNKQHKLAYEEAIKAKDIYDNTTSKEKLIDLPYIPGYLRESAQTPSRIYYKIIKQNEYQINRLIRKIKLLNPPIPMVIINKTSTYIEIKVTNYGDTPLDKFAVEVNYETLKVFNKIYPKKTKIFRVNKSVNIEQLSFKEEYGFAPKTTEYTQE